MKESVAIAKEADRKKDISSTRSGNSIHRVRNEPERQLGSLRGVIGNITRDGGTPSVESIATELSVMPYSNRASALLALQRTHGNRYVQRVVTGVQAKLRVGQPGDVYEQEADRMADLVMRMPEPRVRQPEEEKEEEEEELLQPKASPDQIPEVTSDIASSIQSLKGGGQPLSESTRAFFEPRFGQDFSQVRVYTNSQAAYTAQAINSKAFTVGRDVVFGKGQYAPLTIEGKKLLAHELTHVLQQRILAKPATVHHLIREDRLQRAAPAIGIGAIAAKCIIGAIIGALVDAAIQAALASWKKQSWKFWKTSFNYCSIIFSAILGCIAAPISARLLEPWITSQLGTRLGGIAGPLIGKILLFIAKKLGIAIPKTIVGKLLKLNCISSEQANELGVKSE